MTEMLSKVLMPSLKNSGKPNLAEGTEMTEVDEAAAWRDIAEANNAVEGGASIISWALEVNPEELVNNEEGNFFSKSYNILTRQEVTDTIQKTGAAIIAADTTQGAPPALSPLTQVA